MGTRSYVGKGSGQMARPKARGKSVQRLSIDLPLVLIVACLLIFGILMVYSASSDVSYLWYDDATYIFSRQMLWVGLGIVAALIATWMDYHWWRKFALPAMIAVLGLLFAVLIVSNTRLGADRTLIGSSVQPSEAAKLIVVIYLAAWLYNHRDQLQEFSFGLLPLGTILGLVGGFIALQPDLSAVVTVFFIGVVMFILAGGKLSHLSVVLGLGTFVGWLVLSSGVYATGKERFSSFIEGFSDPTQYSDHVQRSLEAFIQGGWFGAGLGNSRTKLFGLPVPHTDSIFAVIGEELGVLGAVLVVVLFMLLLWRGLVIAGRAPDGLGSLLAGGLVFWLVFEALINMAVMVGLMPFAGNALPFFSVGGSSMLVTMTGIGILLNISRMSNKARHEEETSGAVVDLRRRDGRRRVSRTVRSASYKD